MSRATCLAMLCVLHAIAHGSPRSDPTQGRAVFTGAATASATSIEVNPAALGLGIADVSEIYLAGTAVLDHISIDRRELDIDSGALSPGDSVSGNLVSPGGLLAYVWHPAGRITLAVALHSSPAERFLRNKEALRYHTLGGSHQTYAGTIASSFRLSSRVQLGIGLSIHTSFLHLKFARDTALAAGRDPARGIASDCGGAPCGVENPAATETYDVSVRSDYVALDNIVATIGFTVRLAREWYLGFSYHTPPGLSIQNELTGTVEVERAPRDGGDTIGGAATVYLSQPATFDIELRARVLPDYDLHIGTRLDDVSRMQAYDVRSYGSLFAAANIPEQQLRPRGFHEGLRRFTMSGWAGVEQVEQQFPLTFGARLGFETSALPDERTSPTTISPTSGTLDLGAQYRFYGDALGRKLVVQASYGLQYFPSVDVTNSAFDPRAQLACEDSGFDYTTDACAAVRNGYAIPTAAGEYSRIQQGLRIALRYVW